MARVSAFSSATSTNGHIKPPTSPVEDNIPIKRIRISDRNKNFKTNDPTSDHYIVAEDPTLVPGGSRDLSFIGLQAFVLGLVCGSGICVTSLLVYLHSTWWRLPTFLTCLAVFHFLEYWTTAAYNVPAVRASSFLLFNNGRAYTMAHTMAAMEIVVSNFFPRYQETGVMPLTIALGVVCVVIGQAVRSIAMKQAGTNFNHLVATEHKGDHVLVTSGLYGYFRHPSYFGFFWWALGTQFLVGNKVCLIGYAVVLWRFFYHRIKVEESHLASFFGNEYENFRKSTGTKIPFIP